MQTSFLHVILQFHLFIFSLSSFLSMFPSCPIVCVGRQPTHTESPATTPGPAQWEVFCLHCSAIQFCPPVTLQAHSEQDSEEGSDEEEGGAHLVMLLLEVEETEMRGGSAPCWRELRVALLSLQLGQQEPGLPINK